MGQVVSALMVGVVINDFDQLIKDDEYVWDNYKEPIEKRLHYKQVPDLGEDRRCIGFTFAVSRVAEDGEANLDRSVALSQVATAFPTEQAKAAKRWDEFAVWLKREHNIDLPKPEIILTAIERA